MFRGINRKKLILWAIVVLLLVGFYKFSTSPKNKAIAVKKVSLENRIVKKTVSASGEIKAKNSADLSFALTQKVIFLPVSEGTTVKKGQLLATQESTSVNETAQSYKDARDKALRQKELFIENKEANKDDLGGSDQYEIKLRELDEEISRTQALYNAQQALTRNGYLYAPFDGTVIDILKEKGEIAAAGEVVIKLADLSALYFEAELDQEDLAFLEVGMNGLVNLDAYPIQEIEAKVAFLPFYISDSANTTVLVKSELKNDSNLKVYLGMTGDIKIETAATDTEVPSLYYDEIYKDADNKTYVWTVENDTIAKLNVETGLEGDIYTEIKSQIEKQIVAPITSDADIKVGYKAKVMN